MNNSLNNYDLDAHVSLSTEFDTKKRWVCITLLINGTIIPVMKLHFADDNYGVYWWPTKQTIQNFINILQNIESQMTDETNLDPDEDEDE